MNRSLLSASGLTRLNQQAFATALRETIAWSTPRIDPDNPRWCLRSEELRPPHDYWKESNPGLFNCREYIRHVTTTRSRLVAHEAPDASASNRAGRLLLVDYNISNHNEATELESNAFFDWADNPPWDLWVCEIGDTLVCWIPLVFTDVVSRSMEVECMGMLDWVTADLVQRGYPDWLATYKDGG
jgi:hypothetical protein